MSGAKIRQFFKLVEFLGKALGPSYEVALHDVETGEIVAIANAHISGRSIGSPMTTKALRMLAEEKYKNSDYFLNYSGISVAGKVIRSSTMFIKDKNDKPVALLCINFDDSEFHNLSTALLKIVHPDGFVREHFLEEDEETPCCQEALQEKEEPEIYPNSIEQAMEDMFRKVTCNIDIPFERMTQEEKMQIVTALNNHGLFRLKGAVQHAAEWLCCSQASIYRYLSKVSKK